MWIAPAAGKTAQQHLRSRPKTRSRFRRHRVITNSRPQDQLEKREGNKLENVCVLQMLEWALLVRVTHARTVKVETYLPNKRLLLHLYNARYQERDAKDPYDLHKMRDGISMAEGTLPISLEELYEKEKKRPSRSALSLSQLLEQLKSGAGRADRSATKTEINKRFSFPFSCIAFALIGVPLGITTHRRETSVGFATGLIVAIFYFLFIIIADTARANAKIHPELLVWFPNVLFVVIGAYLFRRLSKQ
jgi:lipopolysaccharide export system permease protein